MSSGGIEVYSNDGYIQINETYRNLQLKDKIPISSVSTYGSWVTSASSSSHLSGCASIRNGVYSNYDGTFTGYRIELGRIKTSNNDLISISCSAKPAHTFNGMYPDFGSHAGEGTQNYILCSNNTGYVYVYNNPTSTLPVGNYGMQIFDENGECVFNTNRKYMDIYSFSTNPYYYGGNYTFDDFAILIPTCSVSSSNYDYVRIFQHFFYYSYNNTGVDVRCCCNSEAGATLAFSLSDKYFAILRVKNQ